MQNLNISRTKKKKISNEIKRLFKIIWWLSFDGKTKNNLFYIFFRVATLFPEFRIVVPALTADFRIIITFL